MYLLTSGLSSKKSQANINATKMLLTRGNGNRIPHPTPRVSNIFVGINIFYLQWSGLFWFPDYVLQFFFCALWYDIGLVWILESFLGWLWWCNKAICDLVSGINYTTHKIVSASFQKLSYFIVWIFHVKSEALLSVCVYINFFFSPCHFIVSCKKGLSKANNPFKVALCLSS